MFTINIQYSNDTIITRHYGPRLKRGGTMEMTIAKIL